MNRLIILTATLSLLSSCVSPSSYDTSEDERILLQRHEAVLASHRTADVDSWMAMEADTVISANGGTITFSTPQERRERRTAYLQATTFESYRDVRPPVVQISDDGSLGWVIAEVEVIGTRTLDTGTSDRSANVWAWIELYRKIDGEWKAVGNVSNSRPLEQ